MLGASGRRQSPGSSPRLRALGALSFDLLIAAIVIVSPGLALSSHAGPPRTIGARSGAGGVLATPTVSPAPGRSVGSLRITLSNAMATSTGPYEQPVVIDSRAYSDLINANWSNGVAYYTGNGTPVDGWIESNATNASMHTLLWLRLASIPAGGTASVSIYFWPKSSFRLSAAGPMGEAPELSASYGAFDDGAQVFPFYDDFTGPNLGPGWTVNGAWTFNVLDGFHYDTVPGNGGAVYTNASFTFPTVLDFYGDLYQVPSGAASPFADEGLGSHSCPGCGGANFVGWSASGPSPIAEQGTVWSNGTNASTSQRYGLFTTEAINSSDALFEWNYSGDQTLTTDVSAGPLPIAVAGTGVHAGLLSHNETTLWVRERAYLATTPTASITEIREYPVTFQASGLPIGTSWTVTLNGTTNASTTSTIGFEAPNGTGLPWTVGAVPGYVATPSSGTLNVSGGPTHEAIAFAAPGSGSRFSVRAWGNVTSSGGGGIYCLGGAPIGVHPEWMVVDFVARPSGGTAPYSYSWEFGDASPTGSGASTSHNYSSYGPWETRLTATDANGSESEVNLTIFNPVPVPPQPLPDCQSTLFGLSLFVAVALLTILALVVIVVAVVAVILYTRRRRTPPVGPPQSPTPPPP